MKNNKIIKRKESIKKYINQHNNQNLKITIK